MKKSVLFSVLAMVVAGSIFAQEDSGKDKSPVKFSVGGGGEFVLLSSFWSESRKVAESYIADYLLGFYGAFDAGLTAIPLSFEFDAGLVFGESRWNSKNGKGSMALDLALYAKYTFIDKPKWLLFAGAGLSFLLYLKAGENNDKPEDNNLWSIVMLFGGGYKFTQRLSLIGRFDLCAEQQHGIAGGNAGTAFKVGVMYSL